MNERKQGRDSSSLNPTIERIRAQQRELAERSKQFLKKRREGKPVSDQKLFDVIERSLAQSDMDEEERAKYLRHLVRLRNSEKDGPLPSEIARLNALGWTDGKIARHLSLSRSTILDYRARFGIPPVPAKKRAK